MKANMPAYAKRFNECKPFMVGMLNFQDLQDAVDAAAAASLLKENAFSAQICQELKPGSCGYAGYSVAIAHFQNGVDLATLATDEDGVPDLPRRSSAFHARGNLPQPPTANASKRRSSKLIVR